jgi:hypothetical protein
MRIHLFCLFFFIQAIKLFSQDSSYHQNSFFVEPIFNAGKSVKINPEIFPKNDFCLLNELNFGWQTLGRKDWHHIYGFPQPGVAFLYAYNGNDVVLGRTFAIEPNLTLHALRTEKNNIEINLGSGFAYFPIIHNPVNNSTNEYIGSHINGIVSFSFMYSKTLSKTLQLKIGVSTFHFSNGHYQLPNGGMKPDRSLL